MNYLIALGSNLHNQRLSPVDIVAQALWSFEGLGLSVQRCSRNYRTPAIPAGSGPDFVNAVAVIRSDYDLVSVARRLRRIEASMGRDRRQRWEARLIDLDILGCGDRVVPDVPTLRRWMGLTLDEAMRTHPDTLLVPHPRLHERGFVLVPMAEVAPDWRHPVLGRTVSEMLDDLPAEALDGIAPIDDMPEERDVAE